jgi:hypothetical protein
MTEKAVSGKWSVEYWKADNPRAWAIAYLDADREISLLNENCECECGEDSHWWHMDSCEQHIKAVEQKAVELLEKGLVDIEEHGGYEILAMKSMRENNPERWNETFEKMRAVLKEGHEKRN